MTKLMRTGIWLFMWLTWTATAAVAQTAGWIPQSASVTFDPVTTFGKTSGFRFLRFDSESTSRSFLRNCKGQTCSNLRAGGYRYEIELTGNRRKENGRVYLFPGRKWVTIDLGVDLGTAADYESGSLDGRVTTQISDGRNWVRLQGMYSTYMEETPINVDGSFHFEVGVGRWILLVYVDGKLRKMLPVTIGSRKPTVAIVDLDPLEKD